jgi:Icc-related predicted phosphoesterase
MRIAALYDVHGNLPVLAAVLAAVRAAGVDCIVVGGDGHTHMQFDRMGGRRAS